MVVDDPDAPGGTFTHWIVVDIASTTKSIAAGKSPGGIQVRNSGGDEEYQAPCPPSGTHHYRFTVYALSHRLELDPSTDMQQALTAINRAATAQGRLTGLFGA
jgi:Raf kinase inhibitor-like YbhB/YbcL family protein